MDQWINTTKMRHKMRLPCIYITFYNQMASPEIGKNPTLHKTLNKFALPNVGPLMVSRIGGPLNVGMGLVHLHSWGPSPQHMKPPFPDGKNHCTLFMSPTYLTKRAMNNSSIPSHVIYIYMYIIIILYYNII